MNEESVKLNRTVKKKGTIKYNKINKDCPSNLNILFYNLPVLSQGEIFLSLPQGGRGVHSQSQWF